MVQCGAGRALWLPYVEVPDVQAATERARALGAQILVEANDGRRAVIGTRAGGEIGLWQPRG
jgi:predicted enzyme related to lactoylglutathione lyase